MTAWRFMHERSTLLLREWEEAFLEDILVKGSRMQQIEKQHSLPGRSGKAILRLILQNAHSPTRNFSHEHSLVDNTYECDEQELLASLADNRILSNSAHFRLTRLESCVFEALKEARAYTTFQILSDLVSSSYGRLVSAKSVSVALYKCRKKLKGSPYTIVYVPDAGLRLETTSAGKTMVSKTHFDAGSIHRNKACGVDLYHLIKLAARYKLEAIEAQLLSIILNAPVPYVSEEYILTAMFMDSEDGDMERSRLDHLFRKLKKKLAKERVRIERVGHRGFRIECDENVVLLKS